MDALQKLLQAHNICLGNHHKSVRELLVEIERGESVLDVDECGRLVRYTHVAVVHIYDDSDETNMLLHVAQEIIATGKRHRLRAKHLSEKMLKGETPLQAAKRGIQEELGLSCVKVIDLVGTRVESAPRGPYGNLKTVYVLYDVKAVMPMAQETFTTIEGGMRHFWEWTKKE